jgi:Ribbon-helix-helix protein, copG family.
MTDKKRITASVDPEVRDLLDDEADKRSMSRSAMVSEVVNEWEQYRDEIDAMRGEVERLRGQLEAERERRAEAEQAAQASDDEGPSAWRVAPWLGLLVAVAAIVLGGGMFLAAPSLPEPGAWQTGGVIVFGFGQLVSVTAVGAFIANAVWGLVQRDADPDTDTDVDASSARTDTGK